MEFVWSVFNRYCLEITEKYDARIHALVVMSNHFHLLLTTPRQNLDEAMNQLMREVSRSINRTAGRINHVFGGPYKWSLIYGPLYYANALKYVYRNPVKAGLCSVVEEYPYSSLQQLLTPEGSAFPIFPSALDDWGILRLPPIAQLNWLNLAFKENEDDCIRRALRHKIFEITPDPKTRQVPDLFQICD
jgi:putative transposase